MLTFVLKHIKILFRGDPGWQVQVLPGMCVPHVRAGQYMGRTSLMPIAEDILPSSRVPPTMNLAWSELSGGAGTEVGLRGASPSTVAGWHRRGTSLHIAEVWQYPFQDASHMCEGPG